MSHSCPSCGGETQAFYFLNDEGDVVWIAPDSDGNLQIPNPYPETFNAAAGSGIQFTGGAPTEISVLLSQRTDNAIQINNGALYVAGADSSPEWTSPNVTPQGGIKVIPGGTQGHTPSFELAVSPTSPAPVTFDSDGRAIIGRSDTPWLGSPGENVVINPGDNAAGQPGNGHRPTIGTRTGSGLPSPLQFEATFDASGNATLEVVNPVTGGRVTLATSF